MLRLALSIYALSASASPLVWRGQLNPRTNCTLGELVCNGPSQFALCGPSGLQFQAVAAGTECSSGQILASAAASSAPALPDAANSTSPAPVSITTSAIPSPVASTPAPTATLPANATGSDSAAPASDAPPTTAYKPYHGDGSAEAGWPAMSSWLSFDALWAANKATLASSCTQFQQPNNSDQENSDMMAAIKSAAQSTGVDARMILAIVLQESRGCVRVWTTSYSVANPGLSQSHAGSGTCNTGISTGGPPTTPGIVTDSSSLALSETDAKAYYAAARKYNSGSVSGDGDLSSIKSVATKSYASDVANRLLGFTGNSVFA